MPVSPHRRPRPARRSRRAARSGHVRWLGAAAIGAGLTVFVISTVAGAAGGTPPAATHPVAARPAPALTGAPAAAVPAPHVAAAHVMAHPAAGRAVHSRRPAPSGPLVISGLAADGIPRVALNAYRVAAARMAAVDPSCGIDWAMLAGIGREESDHGRFAGAVLHPDGTSTPRIIGPALDGTGSDYITAPADGAALDGDSVYTHALGPMQFIPQTWASYGVDGDGDGRADVFDLNDAALAAARYLCAAGGNLRTQAGRVTAVLAYNHNDAYLAQVLALAQAYRTGVPVTGLPVGVLSGPLPPVTAGTLPAVNPGTPTAVGRRTHDRPARARGSNAAGRAQPGRQPARHPASAAPARGESSAPRSAAAAPPPQAPASSTPPTGHPSRPTSTPPVPLPSVLPTPTPPPSCHIGIGGLCVLP